MTDSIAQRAPLRDEVVLDFTHVVAGPMATMLLADVGAQVIKVESPGGDRARVTGGIRTVADGQTISSLAAAFSRGKSSIVLDLKSAAGRQLALDLAAEATVVIENFAPGVMSRLGLDLEDMRRRNPALITASISMYGAEAAARGVTSRGMAIAAEAESGIATRSLSADGPINFGFPLGDHVAAQEAYAGVLTAIVERQLTGAGSHVDISMVAALVRYNSLPIVGYSLVGLRKGENRPAVWGYYPTADSSISIGLTTDDQWARLLAAIARDDLLDDPRFVSASDRTRHSPEITKIITDWTSGRTTEDALLALDPAGIPSGAARSVEEMIDHPSEKVDLFITLDDGLGGTVQVPASPFGELGATRSVPRLGEHTSEVLQRYLSLSEHQVAELARNDAFGASRAAEESLADPDPTSEK